MSTDIVASSGIAHYSLLPLRDVVVFPHMVIPLFVGRTKSIKALEASMEEGRKVLLLAQKNPATDDPTINELHGVGTIASILQLLKLPDGTVKVLVEGIDRALVTSLHEGEHFWEAEATSLPDESKVVTSQIEALKRTLLNEFEQFLKLNKRMNPEIFSSFSNIQEPGRLADSIAAQLPLKLDQKQEILDLSDVQDRCEQLLVYLQGEIDVLQVEKRIRGRVKRQMEKSQREYYLNEQVKAIQKELGDGEEGAELDELENKIKAAQMSKEAKEKAESELKKLRLMPPMSAEATVVRNYLDVMVALPWNKKTKVSRDLENAEKVLNKDHFGLEKVKERIVEYLAVQTRIEDVKSPILCLVGPPGVGKTSLGQSIADATNRKFVRMALGGLHDEAEIRGHRRTYIGSMPGKVLQNLTRIGVRNPLFLLDEIDKIGQDFRGDPASALLELLDPEQNHTFVDHYLEVPFDLSKVMFVATANTLKIHPALRDRMEVIRLAGYTDDEKMHIVLDYLWPKQLKANGLKASEIAITEPAILEILHYYTRESGVRSLEKELAKICRKVVRQLAKTEKKTKVRVTPANLESFLGVRIYSFGVAEKSNQIGQVTGLAWTEVGGELLTIEAVKFPGKGKMQTTGKLGDVMKESVQAAMSVVRARSAAYGIASDFHEKTDIHVHLPEGATPKDGPSAGIALVTAIISVLSQIPVRSDVAMTGEITLRGEVLPIGGLKEKLLAARRGGIKKVLIPRENVKDLADIPDNIKNQLEIIPVQWIEEVLAEALESLPKEPNNLMVSLPVPELASGKTKRISKARTVR